MPSNLTATEHGLVDGLTGEADPIVMSRKGDHATYAMESTMSEIANSVSKQGNSYRR
jgi:hypothetical protein